MCAGGIGKPNIFPNGAVRMAKIKDKAYRQFLDTGLIEMIDIDAFRLLLQSVQHQDIQQARALCILLYFSGRRPSELLDLRAKNITRNKLYLKMFILTKKKGVPTTLFIHKNNLINEVLDYAGKCFHPDMLLFWHFRSECKKTIRKKERDAEGKETIKTYNEIETSKKLWYWFKKWFGITPYFFRHNLLSYMAAHGATDYELMHQKGSRRIDSVLPYRHFSEQQAKKAARYLPK